MAIITCANPACPYKTYRIGLFVPASDMKGWVCPTCRTGGKIHPQRDQSRPLPPHRPLPQ